MPVHLDTYKLSSRTRHTCQTHSLPREIQPEKRKRFLGRLNNFKQALLKSKPQSLRSTLLHHAHGHRRNSAGAGVFTDVHPQIFGSLHIFPLHLPTRMHNDGMTTMTSTPRARGPARACDRCRRRKARVRLVKAKRETQDSHTNYFDLASAILETHLQVAAAVAQLRHNARLICRSLDVGPRQNDTSLTVLLMRTPCIVLLHLWEFRDEIPQFEDSVNLLRPSSPWKDGNLGSR